MDKDSIREMYEINTKYNALQKEKKHNYRINNYSATK